MSGKIGCAISDTGVLAPLCETEDPSSDPDPEPLDSESDGTYDNAGYSLNGVACSDGANGLITKGFDTLGDLPTFPHIGGSHAVAAWNSPNCGSCWELEYGGNKINVLAVDTAGVGFNIAWRAMMDLAGPAGVRAGKILVNYKQVGPSVCGL